MFEHFEVTITPLNRKRMVRVYLPDNYNEDNTRRYPVLYMHDGQNLYKDEDAGYGMCWGISDFLNRSDIDLIVVGIDCNTEGFKRLDEYSPWESKEIGKIIPDLDGPLGGEGKQYIDFIAKELKPMIDSKYRTNPEETSMAGSSMGGLISTYAACSYPEIFKRIASVSSAYWFCQEDMEEFIRKSNLSAIERFYLDTGTMEGSQKEDWERYIDSSEAVYALLREKIKNCRFSIIEGAAHNEKAWRARVPDIFEFLYR